MILINHDDLPEVHPGDISPECLAAYVSGLTKINNPRFFERPSEEVPDQYAIAAGRAILAQNETIRQYIDGRILPMPADYSHAKAMYSMAVFWLASNKVCPEKEIYNQAVKECVQVTRNIRGKRDAEFQNAIVNAFEHYSEIAAALGALIKK